jgi:peroxiredoxin
MPIRQGDKAPVFKLPARPGEVVDLGQFIGKEKTVLLFFPLAFSSVCTAEMCRMRDDWKKWEGLNARVFGICIDSPFVTDKFRQMEKIPFPILSDFNKDVIRQYGVVMEDLVGLKGVAKRSAFVIGRDGKVAYAWVSDDPKQQPKYEDVEQAVRGAA